MSNFENSFHEWTGFHCDPINKRTFRHFKNSSFNDKDYKLLSSDPAVSITDLKCFDKNDPAKKDLYNDKAYKIIVSDKAMDLGFYEEKKLKYEKTKKVKSKAVVHQEITVTVSRKMMEYQRFIRNQQIERAKILLKNLDSEAYKKEPNDVTRFIKRKRNLI